MAQCIPSLPRVPSADRLAPNCVIERRTARLALPVTIPETTRTSEKREEKNEEEEKEYDVHSVKAAEEDKLFRIIKDLKQSWKDSAHALYPRGYLNNMSLEDRNIMEEKIRSLFDEAMANLISEEWQRARVDEDGIRKIELSDRRDLAPYLDADGWLNSREEGNTFFVIKRKPADHC